MNVLQATPAGSNTRTGTGLRRLLLFAYYFPPENESGAKRPYRFVRYLEQHGYQAHVITASRQHPGAPWKDATEAPGAMPAARRVQAGACIGAAIQRVIPYNDQLPWVAHAVAEAQRLASTLRPDAIISTAPPVACHLAAWRTKRRFRLPWVADFRDPICGNPHRTRKLSRPYDAFVERLIVNNADAIIANTDAAGETLGRRYPQWAHKIHVIWNGYDPEERLEPLPIPRRERKVLLHCGSLYAGRNPGAVVAAMDRLIARGQLDPAKVRLRLIGWMDCSQPWVSRPEFRNLQNHGCLEYVNQVVPEPEAIREMGLADYLLLLDGNEMGMAVQVPAKLFQYIRIGRPVLAITPQGSPSERILARSGIRYVAADPNACQEQIDERIMRMFNLPAEPSEPSRWFEEQFNAEAQTAMLASILESLTRTQ